MVVAVFFENRSLACGCFVASLWLYLKSINFHKKKVFISIILLALFLFIAAFVFKHNSSIGRLLIYKVSLQLLKQNLICGVGFGNFKINYLYAQANYFRTGHYTVKELLLADSTQYAFNEYLQFIIELGLAGLALIVCFYSLMFVAIKKTMLKKPSQLLLLSIAVFISLTTAACFNYIFHLSIFATIYIICCTHIIGCGLNKRWVNIVGIAISLITIITIWVDSYSMFIFHSRALRKFKEATELGQAGYRSESYQQLDSLYKDLKTYPMYLEAYGESALQQGYPNKALRAFQQQKKNKLYHSLFLSIGDCYNKLNKKNEAEKSYQLAIDMVPNRFVSRYKLFEFYLNNNELKKAAAIGKGILELPIKIQSAQVNRIKGLVAIKLIKNFHNK